MDGELYDPIRKKHVPATPEEIVRQRLLCVMVGSLGYPKGLLAVEKEVATLSGRGTNRRVDLVCFAPGHGGARALLLVECKADRLSETAKRQALGYNEAIGAPFIALAGGGEVWTFWKEQGRMASVPFLPRFAELVEKQCQI